MKASIIIRAFNAKETIKRAVESALSQDYPRDDFEIVIINDGSTDNTKEILLTWKDTKGVRIFHEENNGAVIAANKGFEMSKGDYVILLDSDDFFEPEIIRELAQALDENQEIDFVYPDYYEEYEGNREVVSPQNIFESTAAGTMFKREKLIKEGGYHTDVKVFYEYDLLLRTLDRWKSFHVPKPLFTFCRRKGSVTSDSSSNEIALKYLRDIHPDKLEQIQKIRTYSLSNG